LAVKSLSRDPGGPKFGTPLAFYRYLHCVKIPAFYVQPFWSYSQKS